MIRFGQTTETPLSRADLPWLGGAILAGGLVGPALLLLGLIGCGDRYINRRHCRRRGRYERIRKDLSVTTPTRKFFPAGGLSAVTLTKVPATWRPLPPPLSTLQSMRPGRGFFHASVLVVVVVVVASSAPGRVRRPPRDPVASQGTLGIDPGTARRRSGRWHPPLQPPLYWWDE
jgi:hypothetical protein